MKPSQGVQRGSQQDRELGDPSSSPGSKNPGTEPRIGSCEGPLSKGPGSLENLGTARRPEGMGSGCLSPGCFWGGPQTCRAPGPERRPSPRRSCAAGRRSSEPCSGTAGAGGGAARAPYGSALTVCLHLRDLGRRLPSVLSSGGSGLEAGTQVPVF